MQSLIYVIYLINITKMKLLIKYMVSNRCKMVVKSELNKLGLYYGKVELGEVEVSGDLTAFQYDQLKTKLLKSGLELIDDRKAILIEKVKNVIIEMIHYTDKPHPGKISDYISQRLHHDYASLAHLFADVTGTTIEHYIIRHKIERVKELLVYHEFNLTEISYMLNYSSVAHLSSQFKKVTGLTPTFFMQLKLKRQNTSV
jgi:AraC-like DNA-binding protein